MRWVGAEPNETSEDGQKGSGISFVWEDGTTGHSGAGTGVRQTASIGQDLALGPWEVLTEREEPREHDKTHWPLARGVAGRKVGEQTTHPRSSPPLRVRTQLTNYLLSCTVLG